MQPSHRSVQLRIFASNFHCGSSTLHHPAGLSLFIRRLGFALGHLIEWSSVPAMYPPVRGELVSPFEIQVPGAEPLVLEAYGEDLYSPESDTPPDRIPAKAAHDLPTVYPGSAGCPGPVRTCILAGLHETSGPRSAREMRPQTHPGTGPKHCTFILSKGARASVQCEDRGHPNRLPRKNLHRPGGRNNVLIWLGNHVSGQSQKRLWWLRRFPESDRRRLA